MSQEISAKADAVPASNWLLDMRGRELLALLGAIGFVAWRYFSH